MHGQTITMVGNGIIGFAKFYKTQIINYRLVITLGGGLQFLGEFRITEFLSRANRVRNMITYQSHCTVRKSF